MPRYRLLAVDIDGTLVNSRDELTAATRNALRSAREAGIHLVLATGRRYSRTLHLVEPLGLSVPLVTASGALVKDPRTHQTLYRAEFAPGSLRQILTIVSEAGFDPLLCADTFAKRFDFYMACVEAGNAQLEEYLRKNPDDGRHCPRMISDPPEGVFGGFTMGSKDEMLSLERLLHGGLGDRVSTHVLRSPKYAGYMCEIVPGGVSKWSGICHVAEQWGIGPSEICAVGDDVNDIAMIRGAGLGVAMGNALPEVKAAAHRVAPCHDDDGLVSVVRWLLE